MNRNYGGRDRDNRYENRQNEQFSERDYGQGDDTRAYGQMGESRSWNGNDDDDYGSSRRYGRGGSGRQGFGDQNRSYYGSSDDDGRSRGGFGAAQVTNREGRGFGSFTGNNFGGGDFSGLRQNRAPGTDYDSYGPYGASRGAGSFGAAPSHGRYGQDHDHDRGFLDRAGETISSWFGDDDHDHRRQQQRGHRGSGPANYIRSDQRILEDVCDAITQDHLVDGRQIQVTVQDGDVTLDGTVSDRQQKRRAEDLTDNLSGVKHVQNNLRVKSGADDGTNLSYNRDSTSGSLT